jgi:hypothetical protein
VTSNELFQNMSESQSTKNQTSFEPRRPSTCLVPCHLACKVIRSLVPMTTFVAGEETTGQGKDSQEFDLAKLDGQ